MTRLSEGRATSIRHGKADEAILALAAGQHGIVTRAQVLAAGVTSSGLDRRIRLGRVRALHAGVYLVGPVHTTFASAMAGVLACGDRSVVSHRTASALWVQVPQPDAAAVVDVIVPGGDRRRPGLRVHLVRALRSDEVTSLQAIPITTPARTLLDLASAVSARELERAVVEVLGRRLATRTSVTELLDRHRAHRGARRLRALLGDRVGVPARSEAEKRFRSLLGKARLPAPEMNVQVAGIEVDFLWRAERLVVEVDGVAFHSTTGRFESDRRRDLALAAVGLRVIRVSWQQLVKEPEATLVRIGQALARSPDV